MIPAKYTEVLANIVEEGVDLFNFDYDSYLPKEELQNGFVQHFYFREIGFETVEMFQQKLQTRWLEIIDRYNMIFEADAAVLPSDAFTDYTEEESENIQSNRQTSGNGSSVFNDAPLGQTPFDNTHASAITNSEQMNTDGYSEDKQRSRSGLNRSKAAALLEFDKSLRDHKREFYENFRDLFFGVF